MEKTISFITSILEDFGKEFLGIPNIIVNYVIIIFFVLLKLLTSFLMLGGLILAVMTAIGPSTLEENGYFIVVGFISFILQYMTKKIIKNFK